MTVTDQENIILMEDVNKFFDSFQALKNICLLYTSDAADE